MGDAGVLQAAEYIANVKIIAERMFGVPRARCVRAEYDAPLEVPAIWLAACPPKACLYRR